MAVNTATRVSLLQERMRQRDVSLVIVGPSPDLRYLLGRQPIAAERLMILLVSVNGSIMILPDFDAAEFAAGTGFSNLITWSDRDGPADAVASAFSRLALPPNPTVLVDDELPFRFFLQVSDRLGTRLPGLASTILAELRLIKSAEEQERIGRAGELVSIGIDAAMERAQPGMTELELKRAVEAVLWEAGAESLDFVLVQAGANSASPHHMADGTRMELGQCVLVDIAARAQGYYADITQQVFLGEPPEEYVRSYEVVRTAQEAGVQAARPGATVHDVDAAASEVIEASEVAAWNGPSTGHGLGVDVHEPPRVVAGNFMELRPGMVITVEPGVYIPNRFGIRIEDTVLVTEGEPRRLTRGARPLLVKPS